MNQTVDRVKRPCGSLGRLLRTNFVTSHCITLHLPVCFMVKTTEHADADNAVLSIASLRRIVTEFSCQTNAKKLHLHNNSGNL